MGKEDLQAGFDHSIPVSLCKAWRPVEGTWGSFKRPSSDSLTNSLLEHVERGVYQLFHVLLHDGLERLVVDKPHQFFAAILLVIF